MTRFFNRIKRFHRIALSRQKTVGAFDGFVYFAPNGLPGPNEDAAGRYSTLAEMRGRFAAANPQRRL